MMMGVTSVISLTAFFMQTGALYISFSRLVIGLLSEMLTAGR